MVDWQSAIEAVHPPPALEVGLDDWCVLPYSSGTTGRPKGCLHSHRTAGFTMFAGMCWSPNGPESVSLASLPLFHVTGMQQSMTMLIFQGPTMVMRRSWTRRTAAELNARPRGNPTTGTTNMP